MKDGWSVKPLKDYCTNYKSAIVDGPFGSNLKREHFVDKGVPVLKIQNVKEHKIIPKKMSYVTKEKASDLKRHAFQSNDIIMTKLGDPLGVSAIVDDMDDGVIVADLVRIRADKIDTKFLCYQLNALKIKEFINSKQKGATRPRVKISIVRDLPIAAPSIEEQKHVVTILDEAFKKIERAKQNTEQNLQNAREIFESYLSTMLGQHRPSWRKEKLDNTCVVERGSSPRPIKSYLTENKDGVNWVKIGDTKGVTKYITSTKEKITQEGAKRSRKVEKGDFILTNSMSYGRPYIMDTTGYIHDGWFVLRLKEDIDTEFFYYLLSSDFVQKQFSNLAAGAVVKNINSDLVKKAILFIPEKLEQVRIVDTLKIIEQHTHKLEKICHQKLTALEELKQSLLEKAFSGELTSSDNVVTFKQPAQDIETTSPEFAAHVLAYGYYWHEAQRRNRTYGHVKGQKLLQLTESVAHVDMGRQPIKDAAGPNDFQHMLRAKDWAKSQQFFEFVPRRTGNGYDFKKLSNYSQLIDNSIATIKPYQDKLEKILALLLPMNSQQAEVLATVHAAWNNLLLDGVTITNEAIIHEARENWHDSKRNIPKTQFSKAITTIRTNGIVPDGTAKRVTGQECMF